MITRKRLSPTAARENETGSTGWELGVAKTMLTDRKGNCYSWAAAFTYLSRKVGYPSNAIAGESISEKGNRSIHAWTEIEFDGTPYTFDPQIEAVYAANYGINYDLYKKAYGTTPITYVKPEIQEPEEPETPEPDSKLSDILDIVYDGVESPNTAKIALNSENEKYYLGSRRAGLQSRHRQRRSGNRNPAFRSTDRDERRSRISRRRRRVLRRTLTEESGSA